MICRNRSSTRRWEPRCNSPCFGKGKFIKVPVLTGELPTAVAQTGTGGPGDAQEPEGVRQDSGRFYGMQLQELTKDLAANLGISTNNGVLVTTVAPESPAAKAGLTAKDVITAVDDKPVKDPAAFKDAAKGADAKRGVLCYVERADRENFRGHQGGLTGSYRMRMDNPIRANALQRNARFLRAKKIRCLDALDAVLAEGPRATACVDESEADPGDRAQPAPGYFDRAQARRR